MTDVSTRTVNAVRVKMRTTSMPPTLDEITVLAGALRNATRLLRIPEPSAFDENATELWPPSLAVLDIRVGSLEIVLGAIAGITGIVTSTKAILEIFDRIRDRSLRREHISDEAWEASVDRDLDALFGHRPLSGAGDWLRAIEREVNDALDGNASVDIPVGRDPDHRAGPDSPTVLWTIRILHDAIEVVEEIEYP